MNRPVEDNANADAWARFKGVVQLSGFVNSREDITSAVKVASAVSGVKSVKNDMQLK